MNAPVGRSLLCPTPAPPPHPVQATPKVLPWFTAEEAAKMTERIQNAGGWGGAGQGRAECSAGAGPAGPASRVESSRARVLHAGSRLKLLHPVALLGTLNRTSLPSFPLAQAPRLWRPRPAPAPPRCPWPTPPPAWPSRCCWAWPASRASWSAPTPSPPWSPASSTLPPR